MTVYFSKGAWSYLKLDKRTIPTLLHFLTLFSSGIDEVTFCIGFMKNFIAKNEGKFQFIQPESLLAVEVDDYLCTFYMENKPSFHCIESLQKIHSYLPDCFIRISRKYIINMHHVKSIDFERRKVNLSGDKVFRFSVRNARPLKLLFGRK